MIRLEFAPGQQVRIVEPDLKGEITCVVIYHDKSCKYDVEYWADGDRKTAWFYEGQLDHWEDLPTEPTIVIVSPRSKKELEHL